MTDKTPEEWAEEALGIDYARALCSLPYEQAFEMLKTMLAQGYAAGYEAARQQTYEPAYQIGYDIGYKDGLDDLEDEIARPKWVSTVVKMPKEWKLVLVCNPRSIAPTYGRYVGQGKWQINDEPEMSITKVDTVSFVTHWQPLPAAPKDL